MYNKIYYIGNFQLFGGGDSVKYKIILDKGAKNWINERGSILTIEQLKGIGC